MLTRRQNDALTRVGPGTVMGTLMRRYWLPFYLSADLEADGPPARVRLLGEDLIVYRDTGGAVGLVKEQCPHRGASLFFARNEDHGLRCVFHGWKFDGGGSCIDMPSEPPESTFRTRIRQRAYPCRERGGLVWTHLGAPSTATVLPELEWLNCPPAQTYLHLPRVQETNYLQAIEGEYDSSHATILHAGLLGPKTGGSALRNDRPYVTYHTSDAEYGTLIAACYRRRNDPLDYWRIYPFMLPFYTAINITLEDDSVFFTGHAFVPMDDAHTVAFAFSRHPERPFREAELAILRDGLSFAEPPQGVEGFHPTAQTFLPPHRGPYGKYWPKLNASNDWGFDYEAQRARRWSGVAGIWPQDAAVQYGYGPIVDRTQEHLGTSDVGNIAIRRRLLDAAVNLQKQHTAPPGADAPQSYAVRPAQARLAPDVRSWLDEIVPLVEVRR